jgi:hypothetical protein
MDTEQSLVVSGQQVQQQHQPTVVQQLAYGHQVATHMVQQRLIADALALARKLESMKATITMVEQALLACAIHWDEPEVQSLLASLIPKINQAEAVLAGQLNECWPFFKHLFKRGRKAHFGKKGDVWVELGQDSYPGKAIQMKSTTQTMPGNVAPLLKDAFAQICGVRRENPGTLRRIVMLILRSPDTAWPWTNLRYPTGDELAAAAATEINKRFHEAATEFGNRATFKDVMTRMPSQDIGTTNSPQVVRTLLAQQYSQSGAKQFEVVVTKVLWTEGVLLAVGQQQNGQTLVERYHKLVTITYLRPRVVNVQQQQKLSQDLMLLGQQNPQIGMLLSQRSGLLNLGQQIQMQPQTSYELVTRCVEIIAYLPQGHQKKKLLPATEVSQSIQF